jgi:Fungal trichothecene efflux pump (TRI12)
MRLLFNERHLAATNCLLVPWHTDPQRLACMHRWKVCHGHLLKLIMLSNPTASATLLGQMTGGVLCQYIKRSRWILITWCTMLTIFSASMVSIQPGQQSKGIGLMFMACYSVGVIETCSLSLAPLSCATEDIGAALGALGSIRSGGASVATAIFVTILDNKLTKFVPEYVAPAALEAGLPKSSLTALFTNLATGTLKLVPGINPEIITAVAAANARAGADSFRYVWYAVIAFACCSIIAACLTINYGEFLTDDVARKMHGKAVHVPNPGEHLEQKEILDEKASP